MCGQYETVRLLTMGDSTDRCNLQDFCAKHRGHHCSNDTCTISTVRPEPLIGSYLNIQPVSMHTWAIEFCEISRPKIIIAFLFERTGVQPYCPWHLPQPGSEAFCANHSKPNLKPITVSSINALHFYDYLLRLCAA